MPKKPRVWKPGVVRVIINYPREPRPSDITLTPEAIIGLGTGDLEATAREAVEAWIGDLEEKGRLLRLHEIDRERAAIVEKLSVVTSSSESDEGSAGAKISAPPAKAP